MIVLVDDDSVALGAVRDALQDAGYAVSAFDDPRRALEACLADPPQLIIADVRMPEMDGFQLRREYAMQAPDRSTTFLFLSSLSDEDSIVKGLDSGAVDYMVKPASPKIIVAKVSAILRRSAGRLVSEFEGRLEDISFIKLYQFCETKGLTGEVEIMSGDAVFVLRFSGGVPDLASTAGSDDGLSKLYGLTSGQFLIKARLPDFTVGAISRRGPERVQRATGGPRPIGKLSAVRLGERTLQIQSELVGDDSGVISTVVMLDGRVLLKRSSDSAVGGTAAEIEALISAQHARVERELGEKLRTLEQAPAGQSALNKSDELFEKGIGCYRAGRYEDALAAWEEAHRLNPRNRCLEANLEIVRKRLTRGD